MTTVELVWFYPGARKAKRGKHYPNHARLPGTTVTLCGRTHNGEALSLPADAKPDCKLCLRRAVGAGAVYRYDSYDDVRAAPGYKKRLGNCYEYAAKRVLGWDDNTWLGDDDNGRTLVHGTITKYFPIGHGWAIEADGNVRDCVLGVTFHPDDFERLFRPEVFATYTKDEARRKIVEFGHWGAWDLASSFALTR